MSRSTAHSERPPGSPPPRVVDPSSVRGGVDAWLLHELATAGLDLDRFLERAVTLLGERHGCRVGLAIQDEHGVFRMAEVYDPDAGRRPAHVRGRVLTSGEGILGAVVATGGDLFLPDRAATLDARSRLPELAAYLRDHPIHAAMAVPLRDQGELVGAIGVSHQEGGRFSPDDLEELRRWGDNASVAICNARLHERDRRARQLAEALSQFGMAAVRALTETDVLEAARDAADPAVAPLGFAAALADAEGATLTTHLRLADPGALAAWWRQWGASNDLPARGRVDLAPGAPASAVAVFPWTTSVPARGALMVTLEHPLSVETSEMLGTLADHVGTAIDRIRVRRRLEERVRFDELVTGILAHDLRNPLNALGIARELLTANHAAGEPPNARVLGHLGTSLERMQRMISQLLELTLSRSEEGIPVHPQPLSLRQLAERAMEALSFERKGIEVELRAEGDLWGAWDPDRLEQVFANLLGNAVVHGGGDLLVDLEGRDPATVRFAVQSRGLVPVELRPHLFEPFARRGSSASGGLGLGLYICSELISAHGGTLELRSDDEQGVSRFEATLPRKSASTDR